MSGTSQAASRSVPLPPRWRTPVIMVVAALIFAISSPNLARSGQTTDPRLTEIQQETEKLLTEPRIGELTLEKARAARTAIQQQDYANANDIVSGVLAQSQIQAWRFYPFATFVDNIELVGNDAFLADLDGWVAANPDDAIPHLVRAQYYLETAPTRRGIPLFNKVTQDQIAAFRDYLASAAEDIDAAIRLRDDNPYSYYLNLLIVSKEESNPLALEGAFRIAIARFPEYFPLYRWRLQTLTPKWGGSVPAMYDFVYRYAGTGGNSPRLMLYVALYDYLVNTASAYCDSLTTDNDKRKQCVIGCTCAEGVTGPFLEQAAEAMGSDNCLYREDTSRGSYVLDTAAGDVWKAGKYYENAEIKYRRALKDIDATSFPDEEARDLAIASIYDRLAAVADETRQNVAIIAYTDAAIALGGDFALSNHFRACAAYYWLKLYDAGAAICTRFVNNGNNFGARFWLAKNEVAAGHADAALKDYAAVATVDPGWGTRATIDASLLYASRRDFKGMLDILTAYPYLDDERNRSHEDLAVTSNNRCFAYMQLGELEKALLECNRSLQFGSLPEAYSKQQQLMKRLGGGIPAGGDAPK